MRLPHLPVWTGAVGSILIVIALRVRNGQLPRGSSQHPVVAYYRGEWLTVLAGNAVWLAGCAGLVVASAAALSLAGRREASGQLDKVAPACGRIAIGLMIASGVAALQLCVMVHFVSGETALRQWRFESGLFDMAVLVWTLYMLASAAIAWRRRSALAVLALVITAGLVVNPGVGFDWLLVWLGAASLKEAIGRPVPRARPTRTPA